MRQVVRVHRSGSIYIGVSILLGVLSVNSGNNFHYLATAAMLGFMLASGIAGHRNIRAAEVSLTLPDERYADTPFLLSVEVRNPNRRVPLYLIEVQIDGKALLFPEVGPGNTRRQSIAFSFPSRGLQEIREVLLSSVYPFNLFTRYCPVEGDLSAVAFPTPLRPAGERLYLRPDGANGKSPRLRAEEDIIGVRPYADGDSMRQIHWKTSARTGKLSTRLYDDSGGGGGRLIDIDGLLPGGKERALSLAAHAVREAILSGEPIGIRGKGIDCPISAARNDKLAMLERLALYE